MRCSKCGADNREGARFCDKCGGKFSPRCASCGAENRSDAKFCDSCGAAFGADATVATPAAKMNDTPIRVSETSAAENLEGERKTVTMLFADIKGSMDLIEDLDPEEARAIVDRALKLMMGAVRRYGGYVAQSTGDGIFALFGAPVAHEDHPQRALYAALRGGGDDCLSRSVRMSTIPSTTTRVPGSCAGVGVSPPSQATTA